MTEINQSALALKMMRGDTISFNATDKKNNVVTAQIRITWEYSPSVSDSIREMIDTSLSELTKDIAGLM